MVSGSVAGVGQRDLHQLDRVRADGNEVEHLGAQTNALIPAGHLVPEQPGFQRHRLIGILSERLCDLRG